MSTILITILWFLSFIVIHISSQPNNILETDKESRTNNCPTTHRHRKSWAEITQSERELYISGFLTLASQGVVQTFTQTHIQSSHHNDPQFFPWHREFIYRFETAIRNLGNEYSCFTLPYWDSSDEPTPTDVLNNGAELFILNSGLGSNNDGECLNDQGWHEYIPEHDTCLRRDVDYAGDKAYGYCRTGFASAQDIISIVDDYDYFTKWAPHMEAVHAPPHICIGGQMATIYAPDDPLFYLHHSFVDYLWALWQQCIDHISRYNDDEKVVLSFYPLEEDITVKDTFDIGDYDYSYEKGVFWQNADVDNDDQCVDYDKEWFYSTAHISMYIREHNKGRSSNHFAKESLKSLKEENPHETRKEITKKWAEMVCEYEEEERGMKCEAPKGYYDDCSTMEINPETNDIDISLEELIGLEGVTECMIDTRNKYYDWGVLMHQLKYLCAGCYDPFCDRGFLEGKCSYDGNDNYHIEDINNILLKDVSYIYHSNVNSYIMYMCLIVFVVVLMFVLRGCICGNGDKEMLSEMNKTYGTISVRYM